MITRFEQLVNHHKKFFNAFVDLKVTGWHSYSKALNEYTFNFFKTQLDTADKSVHSIGDVMKGNFNDK